MANVDGSGQDGSSTGKITAGNLSVKTLKSKLDGCELDLSMSDLTAVPVSQLNVLKRATHLDLSCNRLTELSDDFSLLTHLVRLDLSQNQLVSLPENFGYLANLQQLDLYKNRLTSLPVSFCRLKQLKWLDVKDNPLTDDLRAVTGDCLDQKQCEQAAQKVVQSMQKVQSDQERERQRKLHQQREEENAKKRLDDAAKREQQAAKKKEKEKKKQESRQRQLKNEARKEPRFIERVGESRKKETDKGKVVQKSSLFSKILGCLWIFIRLCTLLFLVSLCMLMAGGFILYSNCSSRPEWIPNSRPLCHDIYQWSTTGALPNPRNIETAFAGMSLAVVNGTKGFFSATLDISKGSILELRVTFSQVGVVGM